MKTNIDVRWMYRWLAFLLPSLWLFLYVMWILFPACVASEDPAWSPDGKFIVFTCENNSLVNYAPHLMVYLVSPGVGWWKNLTVDMGDLHSSQPLWLFDGRHVIFWGSVSATHAEVDKIYVVNIDSGQIELVSEPGLDMFDPTLSPDGDQVAFYSQMDSGESYIIVMNLDGSELKNLTKDWERFNEGPIWSHDGEQIAFNHGSAPITEEDGIYVTNADGTGRKQLFADPHNSAEVLAWSPDDGQIVVNVRDRRDSVPDKLYMVNVDGSGSEVFPVGLYNVFTFSWSPDGQQIAYPGSRGAFDIYAELYVANSSGTYKQKVARVAGYISDVTWSPDGHRILFDVSGHSGVSGLFTKDAIYVANANGTGFHALNLPPYHWLALLLIPQMFIVKGLLSSALFVRRHAQQATMLIWLTALMELGLLWLTRFDYFGVRCALFLMPGLIWLIFIVWGVRQVKRGDCWLMRIKGEGKELPAVYM